MHLISFEINSIWQFDADEDCREMFFKIAETFLIE